MKTNYKKSNSKWKFTLHHFNIKYNGYASSIHGTCDLKTMGREFQRFNIILIEICFP